jgi:serpin B
MRHFILAALVIVACTPSSTGPSVAPINLTSAEAHIAADAVNAFGTELHAVLPKDGNLFYSPTSIAIALAMTEQGAAGQTKDEMDKVLHLTGNVPTYAALMSRLAASKSPEIAIANRIYTDKSLVIEPAFTKVAPIDGVDFLRDAESARGKVNAWVSDTTHTRIVDLIPPNVLDADTRFVIANAIYFKGSWATAFDAKSTRPETFHGKTDTQAPMMHKALAAGFGAHSGAQVLELAYRHADGPELSMVVVLPEANHALADVEAAYVKEGLGAFASAASSADEVNVTLPKLKMTVELELGTALEALGMPLAFSNNADFTGITHTDPLKISKVLHKAYVDVNEEGTEAAAATAVIGVKATAIEVVPEFRADHPFLFFIRDRASGVVLFAGRCTDPTV